MTLKTKILQANKKEDVLIAAELLRASELVAVATETVYGLAADAKNPKAVEKIFIAKDRPSNHPLIVHISSFEKINYWAKDISPLAKIIAKNFWPGPITLLLKKSENVSNVVTGGLDTIAIRIPQNTVLLELLDILDTGLAAPSANPHKRISPTTAQHVLDGLSGKIAAVLDNGPCGIGVESTILDLTVEVPTILRQGPITQIMIEDVLRTQVIIAHNHSSKVAGNMKEHYQPNTKASLMTFEEIKKYISSPKNSNQKFAIMHYSEFEIGIKSAFLNHIFQKMPLCKNDYARIMYQKLHELDAMKAHKILIEVPPKTAHWGDVLDRLSKATALNKIDHSS
ncbi:MAG: L-threonylcarbamoyladenylate synthase [Candidatus Dependentiae bacterium]|nr:L-threonylcarbamoyladenylate synthase [Candidatus Dependentiae bacterium]